MTEDVPWPEEPPDLDAETDIGTYEEADPLPAVHAGRDVDQSQHWLRIGRDQTNVTINQYVAELVNAILPKRHTRAEVLAEQLRCYIPPDGLTEMAWGLVKERLVVLLCPAVERNCGQRAAAAFLVHQRNRLLTSASPLDFQEPDNEERALEETVNGATGVALYLDCSAEGSDTAADRLRQLGVLENRLSENGCVAIMAIPDVLADEAHKQFPGRVHVLGRPRADDVFRIRSKRLTPQLIDALLADRGFAAALHDAWPPYATRIAKLADEAYDNDITDVPGIKRHVIGALSNWRQEAREELRKHSTAPLRALLLATAMLENAGPVTVVKARELLLQASHYSTEPVNALEVTDVVTELELLGSSVVDAQAGRFKRTDFGTALLHLAWREYPGLQRVLLDWLDRLPAAVATRTMNELDGLSQRVVALSALDGGGQIAVEVARRWTSVSPRPDAARRVAAVLLLREACLHPRIGHDMRRRVYQDSYHGGRSPRFRAALAEAIGWFDTTHQAAAMTRLKHLARGPEVEVTTAVVEAVARLAGEMTLGQLLRYLADWLHTGDPRRAEVAAAAAIRAMDSSGTLRAAPEWATDSTAFWRKALDSLPSKDVAALVKSLFRFTGPNPDDLGAVVFQLCHAAGADLRRVGQLLYATRPVGDELEDEAVNELFQQVRLRLDELLPAHPDEQEN